MRVSLIAMVCLLVVTFAFGIGDAEAQYGGGKVAGKVAAAPAHPPKKTTGAAAAKAHPAHLQAKAQQKAKAAVSKEAQRKAAASNAAPKTQKGSPQQKQDAKKNQARKEAERKAGKAARAPAASAQESISLLHAAYQKLQGVHHDYGGHRTLAMRHIGAALGHLGSSAPSTEAIRGDVNRPVSDTLLKEARGNLEKTRYQFAARSGAAAGHGEARRAVDEAIREIDWALTVR